MSSATFAPLHKFCRKELFCARKKFNAMDEKNKLLLHTENFAMQNALGFYSNRRFEQDDTYEYYHIPVEPPRTDKDASTSPPADKKPPGKKNNA